MSVQEEPQACTKCGYTPEDILMLSCGHDLCLHCASDRLGFEILKKPNADAISCQRCYEKTSLDAESILVLKDLLKNSKIQGKPMQGTPINASDGQNFGKYQDEAKYGKDSVLGSGTEKIQEKYQYNKYIIVDCSDRTTFNNSSNSNIKSRTNIDILQGISSKKNCSEHTDEQLLYFCFDCKCECICPECVIHGKHKDHNVKTIRKSQPIIKQQVDKYIKQYENNVDKLMMKKSQIEKHIRLATEQNSLTKKQIEQTFEDFRKKIMQKEKELLGKCDQNLSDNLSELEKCSKNIGKKIDELRVYISSINQASRRQQILFLNFYSKKYTQLKQVTKEPEIPSLQTQTINNDNVITSVKNANEQISQIQIGCKSQVHELNE